MHGSSAADHSNINLTTTDDNIDANAMTANNDQSGIGEQNENLIHEVVYKIQEKFSKGVSELETKILQKDCVLLLVVALYKKTGVS